MGEIADRSFEFLSSKEWLVTNGIGGFASGTLSGANTRRYHGLLVATIRPPSERRVLISNVEELISCRGDSFYISSHQYAGAVYPQGYRNIHAFEKKLFPRWTFANGDVVISKSIFMLHRHNSTIIEYENTGLHHLQLDVNPFFVLRDYHHLRKSPDDLDLSVSTAGADHVIVASGTQNDKVHIFFANGAFTHSPDIYYQFEYACELERGLDHKEDAGSIGWFSFGIESGAKVHFIVSTESVLPPGHPEEWKRNETARLEAWAGNAPDGFLKDLIISGEQFVAWRESSQSHTVIAGYHWFTDWGRDTMIAMRGLIIALGKKELAESIFLTFLRYLDEGLIPNRFPDVGIKPEYNTMDATLWLFISLYEYYQTFGDSEFIQRMFPSLTEIIESHLKGTKYNIHVRKDGLLCGGKLNTQLTWMDARVGEHVVTPRFGCPVEINALWYNALRVYIEFGQLLKRDVRIYESMAMNTEESFRHHFYNDKGYLNDVVLPGDYADDAIRPNQIYAVSLPFPLLPPEECKSILDVVDSHLYTSLGLRSLSPAHPDFKGTYTGDQWHRDHAYHQGTIWMYLWGEYALAYLHIHSYSDHARSEIRSRMKALEHHFYHDTCMHGLSEIFDGGQPGSGKGCIHQAWSAGMLILVLKKLEIDPSPQARKRA